jgi:hypothetical protein
MLVLRIVAFAVAIVSALPAAAQDVDLALVLSADASGSIDQAEFTLQREGIAGAITDPEVMAAIKSGAHGKIAVTLVEWGSPGMPVQVVGWHIVGNDERSQDFAMDVRNAPRAPQSYNAIGDGMALAIELIASCPCNPTRKVIDVSGDNPDMRSKIPSPLARDMAVKAGITVNALAILQDSRQGPNGRPWLVEIYEQQVIGGFAAFVIPAQTRADFARALRQKLIQEIALR